MAFVICCAVYKAGELEKTDAKGSEVFRAPEGHDVCLKLSIITLRIVMASKLPTLIYSVNTYVMAYDCLLQHSWQINTKSKNI